MRRIRVWVVGIATILLALLPNRKIHPSQAMVGIMDATQMWKDWEDVSLRLLKGEKLEEYFQGLHASRRFNGAVLIAEQGTILHQGAYGFSHFPSRRPLTLESSFQLASVSKVFTATAVLLLYEDGLIQDLDDELCSYLPGWPYEKMTIRHLLQHRTGMARYMAVASWYWKDWKKPMANSDVLHQFVKHDPITFFRPGRRFNYCNTNYVILASLVEKLSGQSFAEFMKERVFEPLEMDQAMIYSRVQDPIIPHEAIGYKAGWRGYYRAPNDYIDGVVGDKGMYASVMDVFKFDRALTEGRLLKESTLFEMAQQGGKRWKSNYGFGWRLKKMDGKQIMYHFGWWRGFRTCYIRDVEDDRTIIILTNRDHPGRNMKYWNIYHKLESWDVE